MVVIRSMIEQSSIPNSHLLIVFSGHKVRFCIPLICVEIVYWQSSVYSASQKS